MTDQDPIFGGPRLRSEDAAGVASALGSDAPWSGPAVPIPCPRRPRRGDHQSDASRSAAPYRPVETTDRADVDFVAHGRTDDPTAAGDPVAHPVVQAARTLGVDLASLDPDERARSRRRLSDAAAAAAEAHDQGRVEVAFEVLAAALDDDLRYREAVAFCAAARDQRPATAVADRA